MKTRLIVNPRSGTTQSKEAIVNAAVDILGGCGHDVEVVMTACHGHARELAGQAVADGCGIVVACGGDGTVNEVAGALCNTGTSFGIVPCGSGNGLARHLRIPLDAEGALRVIADGRVERCDYCTANGRPFFCTFGIGLDAAVGHRFASDPSHRGMVNYLRSAIKEAVGYKSEEYTITTDAGTVVDRALIIACCNASQYGNNAFIAPGASIADGLMDVTVIHAGTWLGHAVSGIELMSGALHNSPRVDTFRTRSVDIIRQSAGPVHLDGEPAEMGRELHIACHHSAINIFSPGELKVVPVLTPLGIDVP